MGRKRRQWRNQYHHEKRARHAGISGFNGRRHGVKIRDDTFSRVYVKYFDRDSSVVPDGTDAHDAWDMFRGGFRLDSEPSNENSFTLQGDIYTGNEDEVYSIPTTNP